MLSSHRSSASFVAALAGPVLLAGMAKAQLNGLRGTIPGSLHQCESTNMFFFDSSNTRPLTVLFLPTADVPASARSGTVQLADAAGYSPLQVIEGITTPDAAPYDFTLQLAEGTEFEVFAFFENGEGKALSLTRTVTTALPNASSCLNNVQTTVGGVAAAATTSSSSSSTRSSSTSSTSSRSTSSSMSTSRSTSSSTSARSTTSPTSAPTATAPAANTNFASLSSIIPSPTGAASRNAAGAVAGVLGAAVAGLALL